MSKPKKKITLEEIEDKAREIVQGMLPKLDGFVASFDNKEMEEATMLLRLVQELRRYRLEGKSGDAVVSAEELDGLFKFVSDTFVHAAILMLFLHGVVELTWQDNDLGVRVAHGEHGPEWTKFIQVLVDAGIAKPVNASDEDVPPTPCSEP